MPPLKRRYFILIVVFVLILAAWSARTQLAESIISRAMQNAGLENVTAEIHQLDPGQASVSRLGFSLLTATSTLRLEALDSRINYRPGQLLNGQIDSLVINRLNLHYESRGDTRHEADQNQAIPDPRQIIDALRSALASYAFFRSLSVRQIVLHGETFAVLDGKSLRLTGNRDAGDLRIELSLLDPATTQTPAGLPQIIIPRLTADTLLAELRLNKTPGPPALHLELKLDESVISGNYRIQANGLRRWLQVFAPFPDVVTADSISGDVSFDFEHAERIHSALTASSSGIVVDHYSADAAEFKLLLVYAAAGAEQHLKLLEGSYLRAVNLKTGVSSLADSRIKLQGELDVMAGRWMYRGSLHSNTLLARYDAQQLKLEKLNAEMVADAEQLRVQGGFSPAVLPGRFEFDLSHSFNSATGRLSLRPSSSIDLNNENHQLSQLLTPWPYAFDLLAGTLSVSADASWSENQELNLAAGLAVNDAGGHVGTMVFSGLAFDHRLEILPRLRTLDSGEIHLDHLDSGITASHISAQLSLQPASAGPLPELRLQSLHGDILGGQFSADRQLYDLNRSRNKLLIKASDIDLAEIVETQQLEDISASGRLDGSLPVEIDEAGVSIDHGSLSNRLREGRIRYTPKAGTDQLKQNSLTGIALDALSDFHYSELKAGVNYTPDGMLTINLELKGTSPALDANRPVHLNINTEQNLTSLLESLRFAQGVSESIDKRVRRQYDQNNTNQ